MSELPIDPPLLDVRHLSTHFVTPEGVFHAVEGLSFGWSGESLGLVGESGCGKTTAMLSLLRLLPAAGRIVCGQALLAGRNSLASTNPTCEPFAGTASRWSSRAP